MQVSTFSAEFEAVPVPHKLSQRLKPGVAEELAAAYRAGATTTELAPLFGISHASVLRLLAEQGVTMRMQGLSESGVQIAIELYGEGLSVAAIGTKLGVAPQTAWRALRKAGVKMRPVGGSRPRKRS